MCVGYPGNTSGDTPGDRWHCAQGRVEEGMIPVKALHLGRCAFVYLYYVPTPPAFKPKDFFVRGRLLSRLQ